MQGAKRELYATLLLSNFQVHRHIKATPRLLHTFARPAALVRTHGHDVYANRLNPGNSGGAVEAHETSRWRCRHAVSYIFQLESRGASYTSARCRRLLGRPLIAMHCLGVMAAPLMRSRRCSMHQPIVRRRRPLVYSTFSQNFQ